MMTFLFFFSAFYLGDNIIISIVSRSCVSFKRFLFNICFRAELNRQKQHSLKLGMQIESDYKIIAEVCLRHAEVHS